MAATNRRGSRQPSDSFRRAGVISWSLIGCLLLAGISLYVLYLMRVVFPPVAMALILIFLLNPMVSRLERWGIRRGAGTAMIYLIFIAAVVLGLSLLVPPLGRQINGLVQRGPQIQEDVIAAIESTAERLNLSLEAVGLGGLSSEPAQEGESAGSATPSFLEDLGAGLFAGAGRFATGALHVILNFILAPVFAAYLLIDLPKIQRAGIQYMPPRYRDEWLPLLERIGGTLGSFFRGQLLVALIVGILSSVVFMFIGLPFWLPIGLLAGLFNIVPFVGPFVGGAVAVVVGSIEQGWPLAIKAALAMLAVQQFDNHFISPKVMGWAVRLHPVAVMLALLVGASLGGILGVLLAVPMMGVAKIVFVHFWETRVLGNWDYGISPARDGRAPIPEPDQAEPERTAAAEAPPALESSSDRPASKPSRDQLRPAAPSPDPGT